MTAGELLDILKVSPAPDNFLLLQNQYVIAVVSAWSDACVDFDYDAELGFPEEVAWIGRLWECCDLDQDRFSLIAGISKNKAMKNLQAAALKRYVYPDGTVHPEVKKLLPVIQLKLLRGKI